MGRKIERGHFKANRLFYSSVYGNIRVPKGKRGPSSKKNNMYTDRGREDGQENGGLVRRKIICTQTEDGKTVKKTGA